MESGWYAPGTENDPNAPWNEIDYDDIYGDKARDIIEDEMNSDNDTFVEWLENQECLVEPNKIEESTYKAIIDVLSEDENIKDEYYEYRKEAVIQSLIEEAYEEPDYDLYDDYLEERYAEEC